MNECIHMCVYVCARARVRVCLCDHKTSFRLNAYYVKAYLHHLLGAILIYKR